MRKDEIARFGIIKTRYDKNIKDFLQNKNCDKQNLTGGGLKFTSDGGQNSINANEQNTLWLRRFQMAMMLMIVVAAGLMIVWHYSWIIRPLEKLRDGVETISKGHFGVQIETDQIREFAQVSKGFNQMSRRLHTLYTDLEGQVAKQTQDLARQNRDLTLL